MKVQRLVGKHLFYIYLDVQPKTKSECEKCLLPRWKWTHISLDLVSVWIEKKEHVKLSASSRWIQQNTKKIMHRWCISKQKQKFSLISSGDFWLFSTSEQKNSERKCWMSHTKRRTGRLACLCAGRPLDFPTLSQFNLLLSFVSGRLPMKREINPPCTTRIVLFHVQLYDDFGNMSKRGASFWCLKPACKQRFHNRPNSFCKYA